MDSLPAAGAAFAVGTGGGVAVAGIGVGAGGTAVGGAAAVVGVGGIRVAVGGMSVAVGGTAVAAGAAAIVATSLIAAVGCGLGVAVGAAPHAARTVQATSIRTRMARVWFIAKSLDVR